MPEELDEYWDVLKPEEPTLQEMTGRVEDFRTLARLKAIDDIKKSERKQQVLIYNEEQISRVAGNAIDSFWRHLQEEPKHTDLTGLIQIILVSVVPATELKVFIRNLPRTLLDRILNSVQGSQAGGIHALLSLEVLFRDRLENDYTLTTLSGEDIEVTLVPRTNRAERIQFRLRDNFSLNVPAPPADVRDVPPVADDISWENNDYQEPRR